MKAAQEISGQIQRHDLVNQDVDLSNAKIMVVDDSPLIRELIGACLMTDNYKNITFAEDGRKALDAINEEKPDLIILDLEMPVMDGFELCKILRERPDTAAIPILIQSGRDTAADITRAFDYGASDMVVKPIKKFEILARTKVHLQKNFLMGKLLSYHDRVAQELEQAKQLQLDICPSSEELRGIEKQFGVKVGWHYEPSSELGGDIGGIFPISDSKVAFFMADFSGHGVAAALNTFRMQTWLSGETELFTEPDKLLNKLNNFLHKNLPRGSYATMLFCCLDQNDQSITYASAGCQPPLLMEAGPEKTFELCNSRGMPLGLRENWTYSKCNIPFRQGAKFLVYSDALVEVHVDEDQQLGEEGLREEATELWKTNPTPVQGLNKLVQNFKGRLSGEAPDDLTIIYLENLDEFISN